MDKLINPFSPTLPLCVLAGVYLCILGCTYDCSRYIEVDVRPMHYQGVVVEKSISFPAMRIIYKDQEELKTLRVFDDYNGRPIIDYVQKGDSIIKEAGSLECKVIRGGQVKTFIFSCDE